MIKWLVITSAFSLAQRLGGKDEKALPCDWDKAYKALGLINSSANNSNDKIKPQISKFTIGLPSHFHLIIILIAFFFFFFLFACLFCCYCFETGSLPVLLSWNWYVDQAGFELRKILLGLKTPG